MNCRRVRGLRRLLPVLLCAAALAVDASGSYAHITGVFLYFLKDVQGQTATASTGIIDGQLAETQKRIDALGPQLAAATAHYQAGEQAAAPKVRFYNRYSTAAFTQLIANSQNLSDALAAIHVMQHAVGRDVARLQQLADEKELLEATKRELTQWQALLQVFRDAEKRHAAALASSSSQTQELALYDISESWEEIRKGPFQSYFTWCNGRLRNLSTLGQPGAPGRWTIDEAALNAAIGGEHVPVAGVEAVHVYLRADHVFFVGRFKVPQGERQVIAVGQMTRSSATAIRYHIEYVLVDGFLIPPSDPQMQDVIQHAVLLQMDGRSLDRALSLLQFEQDNGSLQLWKAGA